MCVCVCVRMFLNDKLSFLQLPEVDNVVLYASTACTMIQLNAHLSALRFLSHRYCSCHSSQFQLSNEYR